MSKTIKILICIILLISLGLVVCKSEPVNKYDNYSSYKLEESISQFFHYLKTGDLASAAIYLDKGKEDYNDSLTFKSKTQEKVLKELFKKVDYKIVSYKCKGDEAEVLVELTSPDLLTIYNDMMLKFMEPIIYKYVNGSEMDKVQAKNEAKSKGMSYLVDTLNSNSYTVINSKIKLKAIEENDRWVIIMDEKLIYALTGRMPQLLRK